MKLYFTAAKIGPEYSVLFNRIAVDIRQSFTDFIDSISKQHGKCIDWWVSSPASRNTFSSPLFHYCCCVALLQELIRAKKPIPEIVTDSRAFRKIIEDYLSKQGINARVTWAQKPAKQRLKKLIRPIYTIFGLPLRQIFLFFAAKLTRFLRKQLPSHPLMLIDTFVMPGYIEKDRYYPGVLDALSESEKNQVWFVPHLYGFSPRHFLSVLKRLRKAEKNFILKDDFLKFVDYWCHWGHLIRVHKLKIKAAFFCGLDLSTLVREELTDFQGICSSYIPLLNYRFAKRLYEAKIKLRFVIDWFENQVIDKGWNAGFRQFFPETDTRGYQGFLAHAHYLCMFPTEVEKDSRVVPNKVAVVGKGLVQSARRFCSDLDVCIAPAFRFQHVWQKRKCFPDKNVYTILVALPFIISEAIYILKLLSCKNMDNTGIRFWIKPHPATPEAKIKVAYGATEAEQFKFVNGNFNDYIEKSNLLIMTNASSTCMETLAKGIPVIIIGCQHGLTHIPIPETINSDIWRLCYNTKEIANAIQFYRSCDKRKIKEHEEIGRRIRDDYFEPVTKEGVRRALGLR